jgi:hypothetical protein
MENNIQPMENNILHIPTDYIYSTYSYLLNIFHIFLLITVPSNVLKV